LVAGLRRLQPAWRRRRSVPYHQDKAYGRVPGFFETDTAHYDDLTGQMFGEAGFGFAFGKVVVEPFAGAA
jgi:uncharacterized protein with beta-barrel porin domain